MTFQLQVNDTLLIDDVAYRIAEHPVAPGMPYGQEGRAGTVFQIVADEEKRALKVFKHRFSVPALVTLADQLEEFSGMPGLRVCKRSVLTPRRHRELLRDHPDLTYAVLMPWIEGPTWMDVLLDKRELSPEQSLYLARSFAEVLSSMEESGVAHCDLSGPNLLLPALAPTADGRYPSAIELVDVEQLFGPGLERPGAVPGGSMGYAHQTAPQGLWSAEADRFAGALLFVEMLTWCDERIRRTAWGESYFDPTEMQQKSERYEIMYRLLDERWEHTLARLFEQAWESDRLSDCPTFGRWLVALPETVPVVAPAQAAQAEGSPLQAQHPQTVPGSGADAMDAAHAATPLETTYDDSAARLLMREASALEAAGDAASALSYYREARSVAPVGSALAQELVLIIAHLEAERGSVATSSGAAPTFDNGAELPQPELPKQAISEALIARAEPPLVTIQPELPKQEMSEAPADIAYAVKVEPKTQPTPSYTQEAYAAQLNGQAQELAGQQSAQPAIVLQPEQPSGTQAEAWQPAETPAPIPTAPTAAPKRRWLWLAIPAIMLLALGASAAALLLMAPRPQAASADALSIAFSPDRRILAAVMSDRTVQLWSIEEGTLLHTLDHTAPPREVFFSPDGQTLVSTSEDNTIRLWSVPDGRMIRTLEGDGGSTSAVAFSPNGDTIAGASESSILLWRVSDGELLPTFQEVDEPTNALAFSPNGNILASSTTEGTVQFWSVGEGRLLRARKGSAKGLTLMAFSPDGQVLASTLTQSDNADTMIRLWRTTDGSFYRNLEGHLYEVNSLAFSPDGRTLASASDDQTVRLWGVSSGRLLHTLEGHQDVTLRVAFSPDGQTLASSSADKTVRLWNVEDGTLLHTLEGHTDSVLDIAFSPDGQTLVTSAASNIALHGASTDNSVRVWRVADGGDPELVRTFEIR